ncbi:MAG: hypothetical protein AB7O43_05705 [Hyphomicrobiaceae bacterium]
MSTLRMMAIDEICQRGSIRDGDVEMLRQAFSREPHLTAGDVDALFRIHTLARVQDPSWADFFIETMTDYVVRELEPSGYMTAAHAGWLIARVSTAGRVRSRVEHDMLLNVIDKARWVPETLLAFAIAQIRDAVTCGEGPLRSDGMLQAGIITAGEVEQLRALLYAYGADGPCGITQIEAELMLDIDAALPAEASEEDGIALDAWSDLVIKSIANAVLDASGYACPSREEALSEREPMGAVDQRGVLGCYVRQDAEARALARLERQRIEIITGEPVGDADADRLAARLMPDDGACPRAAPVPILLQQAGFSLHPTLRPTVLEAAATAA